MVKIKEFTENDPGTNEEDTTDDEEVPPVPRDTPLAPLVFLAPEPSAPEGAAGPSIESHSSNAVSPIHGAELSRRHIWYMLRQYNQSIEFNGTIIVNGLSKWAIELQQLAGPGGCGNGEPQFACTITITAAETSDMEDRSTERTASVMEDAESSLQTIDEILDREDGNKTESDESAKEKSNGVAEKVLLATTAEGVLSSPELSDCELSDVSDCLAPPEATSEASDDGEAAALPSSSVVKDCWEEWEDDDRLFSLPAEAPAPSTSTVVTARVPSPASPVSPASPKTERRRIKLKNRHRVRQQAIKIVTRFIFVPTEKIGRIVGKGGRRVRELEKESGAKIIIQHKKSANPITEILLKGTEEETLRADEEICNIVRNFKPPKFGEPTTASVSSAEEQELKRLLFCVGQQMLNSAQHRRESEEETTLDTFEGEE